MPAKQRQTQPRLDSVHYEWSDDGPLSAHCRAVAEVSYPINKQGDRRLEHLSSGGLGGIDTRSSFAYYREVEAEQLADLRDHLSHFGMSWDDQAWSTVAESARLETARRAK